MSYIPDSVLSEQSKTVVNKVTNVLFSSSLISKAGVRQSLGTRPDRV